MRAKLILITLIGLIRFDFNASELNTLILQGHELHPSQGRLGSEGVSASSWDTVNTIVAERSSSTKKLSKRIR